MIYEKVKKLAKAKGISINQIEKDLGFSSSSISKWNSSNPTSSKLKQVADYLGVTMDYLLEDEKQGV
ncbi:helix-turn-helix domain-containing protein [Enterococcus raffinosus]|uniref:helix-turn-helix domain-containing protein n=1 Tax=Enterococcus raffinosus TaxID=71452 RepID=UPI0028910D1E|nr:helix-turn-helix domain-containing protein [Enterococcus raffinosus]MDT2525887.1 helix-turn-helix domain-containing protein [Enterococcus raffinosus]MDT2529236.1 helix-turn-helix domain-containing protein [Enterococcus raffinosus]MDT2536395.1 helix-turn-helix domain-containing protein [Enterococcus raffinosus]MDT2555126.1 helix-turn-helix domain-containing protein [Enterococcus raffinosus]MDT2593169.1 helix-turn-helix domain-containing protein [Enterococcus raffinosus]